MIAAIRTLARPLCLLSIPLLWACDDEINVKTSSADSVLNIDAWINNKPETQHIYLTLSQDYFDNKNLPPVASGALVTVTDNEGHVFKFAEDSTSVTGAYSWYPAKGELLGAVGRSYTLKVVYKGETFTATSVMNRVPIVDSLTLSYREGQGMLDDTYSAEFWAKDPAGKGDTYWMRGYKNGKLLNKASEITTAYDAGVSSGSGFDGVTFISPVRLGVNADDLDSDDRPVSPLANGDSIYVEIHSINLSSFNYLAEVVSQADRMGGISELFTSAPLANVSTNIVNSNKNGSAVVGYFNVAAVSGLGKKFYF
ncbi:DUF4249 domain-containing protein [Dyadobacter subterraneus]|uniref:DUF4249 domain-containing protein n=1 Tax=Dyadobacter subterraneus TaxID=2773304 RepID=A0ABR9WHL7_9BACT|nr:DUF4249 domain-containing protein [Dyadobacter subterraneus]MBE9463851.1 DUF4249 domain-containing protein [Dyadobacter subterraneus]